MDPRDFWPFVYALAIGLLIGFERERSDPPSRRLAGSRSFALVGLVGAAAAFLGGWGRRVAGVLARTQALQTGD